MGARLSGEGSEGSSLLHVLIASTGGGGLRVVGGRIGGSTSRRLPYMEGKLRTQLELGTGGLSS